MVFPSTPEAYREFCEHHANIPGNHIIADRPYYALFHPAPGSSILDFGAYTGGNLTRYGAKGHPVGGIEVAQPYIDTYVKNGGDRDKMWCGMIEDYVPDREWDNVICGEVLEFALDPRAIADKAYECLAKGGKFFVATLKFKMKTHNRAVHLSDLEDWMSRFTLDFALVEGNHLVIQGVK